MENVHVGHQVADQEVHHPPRVNNVWVRMVVGKSILIPVGCQGWNHVRGSEAEDKEG